MLFSTTTQFVALALVLLAGWFFGLASHPGGRKWKERYVNERDAHATDIKQTEARVTAARSESDGRAATADQRIADVERDYRDRAIAANERITELERENERLRSALPVTSATVTSAPYTSATVAPPPRRDDI